MAGPPKIVFASESPVLGLVKGNIAVTISIKNASPIVRPENIKWMFQNNTGLNAVILEENTRYHFTANHQSLTLKNITHTDEGNYSIQATNEVGSDIVSITLEVEGG